MCCSGLVSHRVYLADPIVGRGLGDGIPPVRCGGCGCVGGLRSKRGCGRRGWRVRHGRTKAFNALKDLIITAPGDLREQLAGMHKLHLIAACADLATSGIACTPAEAVSVAVKSLADRCLQLDAETKTLDTQIEALTAHACPALRQVYG